MVWRNPTQMKIPAPGGLPEAGMMHNTFSTGAETTPLEEGDCVTRQKQNYGAVKTNQSSSLQPSMIRRYSLSSFMVTASSMSSSPITSEVT